MATRNIVPRADSEGNIGTSVKRWLKGFFVDGIFYDSSKGIKYNSSTSKWQYNDGSGWKDIGEGGESSDEKVAVHGDSTAGKMHDSLYVREGTGSNAKIRPRFLNTNNSTVASHYRVYTHVFSSRTYTGGSWYRFLTIPNTNYGQIARIILSSKMGHDVAELKFSKTTPGSSNLGIIAEARRLGSYAYAKNIMAFRICSGGANTDTHIEVKFGTGDLTGEVRLYVEGYFAAAESGAPFTVLDMTTGSTGTITKELFISDGTADTNNQTLLGISTLYNDYFYVNGLGRVGIMRSDPQTTLDVNGITRANNFHGKIGTLTPSSGTVTIPMNGEAVYTLTVGSNTSLSFSASNIPSGYVTSVVVIISGATSTCSLSFDSNWKWSGGSISSISSGETVTLSILNYGSSASNIVASMSTLS